MSDVAQSPGLDELLTRYLEARGLPLPVITTGEKALEEATELVAAIAVGDPAGIRAEVADLAIVAAVVARQWGTTVEACVIEKSVSDQGRGEDVLSTEGAFEALRLVRETLPPVELVELARLARLSQAADESDGA